ncbi:LysE family translocator [Pseudodesulfovibrio sp. zrk46]|uniref:LysE family translocator n=1 Tax=Pseudodesulfovibrio sp. zrk46 TaxID=2725288 RepID=UPI00144A25C1|nr:LysE family translocator [Pseudodesulfovibrio sp. zrk46]QJB55709.1 LysE family translocator [Pseudodesulfovibrio sp. zrk46]
MGIELAPLFAFVMVTVYTPGPGTITSAAMGMLYGYRRSLHFLIGNAIGTLLLMTMCAFVSKQLLTTIPSVEPILRALGVCYLLYLTYGTARATYAFDQEERDPMAFKHGFVLQALNPKGIVFGLTLYTTFLASLSTHPKALAISAIILAVMSFSSVSLWAFAGTRISKFLYIPKVRLWVNITLVSLLLYCALSLSGVLG